MIKDAIKKVSRGEDLDETEMVSVMNEIMSGEATPAAIGSFLTALAIKGETTEEITGAVRVMREKVTRIKCDGRGNVLDTCGTGGDHAGTFNISTMAAIVAAGAGAKVAKHGNRSATSKCGSADVLKELGVNIDAEPEVVEKCMEKANVGFLFAPRLHPAMKHAIGPRREIGIRTIFNILGPLTNPADAKHQLIGVFDQKLTKVMAEVLMRLGSEAALIVHGHDKLDEITLTGPTFAHELIDGKVVEREIKPASLGLTECSSDDLKGGEPDYNAKIFKQVLAGESGPARDVTILNAAAALYAARVAPSIEQGLELAAQSIDKGQARDTLGALVQISNEGG